MLSTVLASAIHEIKNGMGILFARIDHFTQSLDLTAAQQNELAQLKTLSDSLNHELVRVLLLYKSNINGFSPNIDQYSLADFFDDSFARHTGTSESCNVKFFKECNDELMGFFDESLISSLLDTAIFNAIKAGATKLHFTAREERKFLVISITDNGPGFPNSILKSNDAPKLHQGANTGLGLYFANTIAQMHENNGVKGFLQLRNVISGGACLEIWLP